MLNFAYDASGTPMAVTYGGATYYYATNIQGDVTAILDSSGTAVVTYTYDAWGDILTTTGTLATTLGTHNPLRYRGYVYDQETGLYYLQSRYYDPALGRFINADAFASTGQGILGNNMFAYCLNNPVNLEDTTGSAATRVFSSVTDPLANPWKDPTTGGGIGSGLGTLGAIALAGSFGDSKAHSKGIALTKSNSSEEQMYTVYFLCAAGDLNQRIIYVGRVKSENFAARMNYHRSMQRQYVYSIDGLTYDQCRFLEQAGMVYYHTINRGNPLNNQIRGISPTNPKRFNYIAAGRALAESDRLGNAILPVSYWANQAENMILNGGP